MTDKNLKNLIDQLQYKSQPAVQERMRESIDRAWNQQNPPQGSTESLPLWRILMNSPKTKFAIAAALIVAVVLGIVPFIKHTTPPTFAEVTSYLMQAENAILTIVIGEPGAAPPIQDMILGNRIRRTVEGIPNVSIIDLETSKILSLDANTKTAVYVELKNLPQIPNYMEHLRNIITILEETEGVEIEYLDRQDLDGRTVIGYKATYPGGQLYLWADPATYAPVQIDQYEGQMTILCKDLQFDVPMDEALFSMEVPEGYTTQQAQLDLASGTEEAFILGLGLWAQYIGDGYYPDDVHVEAFIKNAPMIGQKLEAAGLPESETMQIGMALSRHLLFIRFFKGQGEWVYNGKDVRWGDSEIPVFWYKPKDSPTWRVIWGDLRVEDTAEENLPTVMTDQERTAHKQAYPVPEIMTFTGTEKAVWHFGPGGGIEVHSELMIASGPENATTMPIRLPYEGASLKQVLAGQTELAFEPGEQAGTYTVALPAEPISDLVCIWTMPLEGLEFVDNEYRIQLKSLIPVTDFKLEVILEEGCGLAATYTAETDFTPFTASSPDAKDRFGMWHGLTKAQ
jgi:outer membrane lipoprotein-sorting protein